MSTVRSQGLRALLVYPRFPAFHVVSFQHMIPFYPGRRTVMPPLGLLTLAGGLPESWQVRLVDENVRPITEADLQWADVVALSGMHPQRRRLQELLDWANRLGKLTVVGGASASITPEAYPQADLLHVGELGDATEKMIEYLDQRPPKPPQQLVFATKVKTPLDEQPLPAWNLIDVAQYLVLPLQFSVGCPYRCEFCDIPVIYGRPRAKSAERIVRELEAIYDTGFAGTLSFVDDNLIGDRRALHAMLPQLVRWQQQHGYPYPLSGEASIDLAAEPEILGQLQAARFTHLFLGVESLDAGTLDGIHKKHNVRQPILDSLRTIQSYGIEVMLGVILGFDGDTEQTGPQMARFVEESAAPFVLFNLLAALPKTPLWERLEREGRLLPTPEGDVLQSDQLLVALSTNVQYRLPEGTVQRMLLDAVKTVYRPENLYRRLRWNAENVYGKQRAGRPPLHTWRDCFSIVLFTLGTLWRVLWKVGVVSDYRSQFWRFLALLVRLRLQGRIKSVLEVLLRATPEAHHLITWARQLSDHARQPEAPSPSAAGQELA